MEECTYEISIQKLPGTESLELDQSFGILVNISALPVFIPSILFIVVGIPCS